MNELILKAENISKKFGEVNVLSNVSIGMKAGRIYGLIGQNGAGKTTLMRIITGLAFPSHGSIELFGRSSEKELNMGRRRIGSMIEYPGIISGMTAREHLRYYRIARGIPGKSIEDELLELVGLANTEGKKAVNFSLGMKQRLGIAIALLGNPEILILDEPVNGLDPIGVVEIRNLINKLCDERNMTILISSHNLPELYQVATDYIIIHQGTVRKILTYDELDENCKTYLSIHSITPEKLVNVIETKLNTRNYMVMPDKSVLLADFLDDKEYVARTLFENGIITTHFTTQGDTLENYFINIIGGNKND